MESLIINETKSTPRITFNGDGKLSIEGRSLCEDPRIFYAPVLDWICQFSADAINLDVKLDYLNSSSTKMLNDLIKTIDAKHLIKSKTINWYFEDEDEDMLEAGQIFEENTHATNFFYHQVAEGVY